MIFRVKRAVSCILMLSFSQPAIAWNIERIKNKTSYQARIIRPNFLQSTAPINFVLQSEESQQLSFTVKTRPPHVYDVADINEFANKLTIYIDSKTFYFAHAKLIYCCTPIFGKKSFWFYSDNQEPSIQKILAPQGPSSYNLILKEERGAITCSLESIDDQTTPNYGTLD